MTTERATAGLVVGRLHVAPEHVVFVKGVIEASDGLACLFADRGGDLCIASPADRTAELRELLEDLAGELGGTLLFGAAARPAGAAEVTPAKAQEKLQAPRAQGAHQASPAPR
ncbi:MAG: DUF4911 domain-containing protein [Polyangiaceae bacterium]